MNTLEVRILKQCFFKSLGPNALKHWEIRKNVMGLHERVHPADDNAACHAKVQKRPVVSYTQPATT